MKVKSNIIDKYIVDRNGIIKVYVDKKDDFYNQYDPLNKSINFDIANYIIEEANNIPFRYKLKIEFFSDDLTESEKDSIRKILKEYYAFEIKKEENILKASAIKGICLLLMGILIITSEILGIWSNIAYDKIFLEVMDILAWVLLWESIDILLLSNNKEKIKKKNLIQIYKSEILFSDKLEK